MANSSTDRDFILSTVDHEIRYGPTNCLAPDRTPPPLSETLTTSSDTIDRSPSTLGALPRKASYRGGRTKPLMYSTKHSRLLDVGLRRPIIPKSLSQFIANFNFMVHHEPYEVMVNARMHHRLY